MKVTVHLALLCASALALKYDRLSYLKLYEDDPTDEFLEMLKPNEDGTTFLDDSYFLHISIRYEWRKGAENYDPAKYFPKLTDDEYNTLLAKLQEENVSLTTPLLLADVIEEEWRHWAVEPDFPKKQQIKEMGVDDLIRGGTRWEDGQELKMSESSMNSQESVSIEEEGEAEANPVHIVDATSFRDLQ